MRRQLAALIALTGALILGSCGTTGSSPQSTGPDDPVDSDSDTSTGPAGGDLLADTTGDAPFYIDQITVRIAESYPVQLFLDVEGNAPTPGHAVAYTVQADGDQIDVTITTQSGEGGSAAVLQPHTFAIPLGPAELPVTIDVNDGEFVETVDP